MNIRERHPVPSPRPTGRADPPQLPVRRLLQFGALCLVLSWVPWSVLGALGADVDEGLAALVFGLAAAGPSLAALAMWLLMRRERSGGPRRPGTRLNWGWPVAAIVLGATPPVVAAVVLGLDDLGAIPLHVASVAAGVGGPLGVLAYTLVAGPLAEESSDALLPAHGDAGASVQTAVALAVAVAVAIVWRARIGGQVGAARSG
jgi:hypothetical protein